MKFRLSKTSFAALAALVVVAGLGLSVYRTTNIEYVYAVQNILGPVGIGMAVFYGFAFAHYVGKQASSHPISPRGVVTGFIVQALLLGVPSTLFVLEGSRPAVVGLMLAAVFLGLAVIAHKSARMGVRPAWVKYLLIGGAFVGGALPGLLIWFILSIAVSQRYCDLTSSKCL